MRTRAIAVQVALEDIEYQEEFLESRSSDVSSQTYVQHSWPAVEFVQTQPTDPLH